MDNILFEWFRRQFSNAQLVILLILLATLFAVILIFGQMLGPALVAIVLAYLMDTPIERLKLRGFNQSISIGMVYLLFITLLVFMIVVLLPLLSSQITEFLSAVPAMVQSGRTMVAELPETYPALLSVEQLNEIVNTMSRSMTEFAQQALSKSLSYIPGIITVLIYLVLVPLLVFFMVKDKRVLFSWFTSFLPDDHSLAEQVWHEVDLQIGNYIRGKFWEMFIVGSATYLAFVWLGLQYSLLLGVLVGLSVLVPFVGATVVTIPVAAVAFYQFGWGGEFGTVMLIYGVIQALDGNVLVPLLFSEVVNLHPVAIIVAVLFFGGLWGFWGVFFAIPLATLVKAVISAWPKLR
ncbi:MAG: AI-2E family transporter [Gammaproteobacteria bacterium]|jgi:putative permease|nr:AI-2E family transporter [Gammaproteobacteria bacterium]MBT7309043.1 AI-2E family transporter [Gammaproteobacteria bacterium]